MELARNPRYSGGS